jgi:hypothetical protein
MPTTEVKAALENLSADDDRLIPRTLLVAPRKRVSTEASKSWFADLNAERRFPMYGEWLAPFQAAGTMRAAQTALAL